MVLGIRQILHLQCLVSAWFLCDAIIIKTTNCSTGGILCEAHYIKAENCSERVLSQTFPHLYHRPDDLFPGKPYKFVVEPFDKPHPDHPNYTCSGAKLVITTPVTSGIKDTRGFQVMFYPISEFSTDTVRCIIFDFPNNLTAQDRKEEVSHELYPLYSNSGFFFETYSLPKPPPSEDQYLWYFMKTKTKWISTYQASSDWSTVISYYNNSAQKEIYFNYVLPPSKYNFTRFNLELWRDSERVRFNTISQTEYTFSKLIPGTYRVKIQPNDTYWQDNYKCLCKDNQHRCKQCIVTTTEPIIIQGTQPILTTTTTLTNHRLPTKSPHTTNPSDPVPVDTTVKTAVTPHHDETRLQQPNLDPTGVSQDTVIIVVCSLVLGIVLVTVVVFILFHNRRNNKDPNMYVTNRDNNQNFTRREDAGSYINTNLDIEIERRNNTYRVLQTKKVFILYAEDHPAHVDVIKSFAVFLSTHCRCEVIFAPWCMSEVNQDKIRWIMRSFDRASYTIVINSLSAYHQFKSGKRLRSAHDSPLADMFYLGINQIHHRVCLNSAYGKLINVCFEYTKKEFFIDDLCAGAQYVLMKHLQDLLCHIHNVNQQTTQMKDVGLAFVEDITVLPEGNTLVRNLQTATLYEKSHPQWFEQDYFDSGVDSAENLPIEDRNTIKEDYERNFTREKRMDDSISKIIENQDKTEWNIPIYSAQNDLEPSEAFTYHGESSQNLECAYSPSFVAPSDIGEPPDICSNYLLNEIQEINNKYIEETQLQIAEGHTNLGLEGEECISLGGQSV